MGDGGAVEVTVRDGGEGDGGGGGGGGLVCWGKKATHTLPY